MNTPNSDIEELIDGCKNGNPACQKKLYESIGPKMLSVCLRYCKSYDTAMDALQEGFIKVFSHIQGFRGESKFETWVTRIIIHAALNEIKKNAKYYINDQEDFTESASDSLTANPNILSKMSYDELILLLQKLPDGYRVIFNMYVIEGFSHKEIASTLGIQEGTSKSQLNRARKMLQSLIQKQAQVFHA